VLQTILFSKTFLVALSLALLATLYVVWPLFRDTKRIAPADDDPLVRLIQRKDAVIQAIKELELDYNTGKLIDVDYERMNDRLRRQAMGLLKQMEKAAPDATRLEKQLEAEIAMLRRESQQK